VLSSILVTGIALGSVYALIGVTYNVMFSASRVMSFTAGQMGMLGGVLGAMFIARLGVPVPLGLLATLAACALLGLATEFVAVRPVLASLDRAVQRCCMGCTEAALLHTRSEVGG